MGVYGRPEFAQDRNPVAFSEGYKVICKAMADPMSVQLFHSNGKYYVTSEAVEDYMLSVGDCDFSEAVENIASANNISSSLIECVGMNSELGVVSEAVMLEKAAEDNAMTLKQAEKYYAAVLKNCKSKAETKEQIDDTIKVLKECVKDMKAAKNKAKSDLLDGGRVKYALKTLIPFNSIWRLFKRNDWMAGVGGLTKFGINTAMQIYVFSAAKEGGKALATGNASGFVQGLNKAAGGVKASGVVAPVLTVAQLGVRLATYEKMLDRNIQKTEEAIAYLEDKKKKL